MGGRVILSVREETTVGNVSIIDVCCIGCRAGNKDFVQDLIVSLYFCGSSARFRSQFRNQCRVLSQVIVILEGQILVSSLRGRDCVRVFEIFEGIEPLNRKRFGADARNLLVDVNVETLNQRNYRNKGGHANDHTE